MNEIKKEINKISVPEKKLDKAIKKGFKQNKKFGKKRLYMSVAAALMLSLLLSSAFTSPTMANVFSKIPVINNMINTEQDISSLIEERVTKEGANVKFVSVSYKPNKMIEIGIKGEGEEELIKNITTSFLEENKYEGFKIKVLKSDSISPESGLNKEESILEKKIIDTLNQQDIKVVAYGLSKEEKVINLKIQAPKNYFEDIKKDAETTIRQILLLNGFEGFEINFRRQDPVDQTWAGTILPKISTALMSKRNYHVTSVSYSVTPKPVIIVKTSAINKTEYAKTLQTQIEKNIKAILFSQELQPLLNNQPYEIHIYNDEQKRIN